MPEELSGGWLQNAYLRGGVRLLVMGVRRRWLNPGERVLLETHPHWGSLVAPATTVVAAVAGALSGVAESAPSWVGWLSVAALGASLAWLLARYARWRSTLLVVTDRRVVERRGLLARQGREVPLSALTGVSFRQRLLERLVGAGTVVLEPAGGALEVFAGLLHPAAIYQEICRQLDAARQPVAPPAREDSVPERIEQLDQLRRSGLISEAEFEQLRSRLLDRL